MFLEHVAEHWPPTARAALPLVVREVARAIVPSIGTESSRSLAAALGESVLRDAEREPTTLLTLYASVAGVAGVSSPTAVELTQMIFGALARALDANARERLASELPPPWGELLDDGREDQGAGDLGAEPPHDGEHTLATGHPGANRPLASAHPLAGQAGSVAASDDPHADRRLASTIGPVPPERTLADAQPKRS